MKGKYMINGAGQLTDNTMADNTCILSRCSETSSTQYINHAFQVDVHTLPPDGTTTPHATTFGDHVIKTKRAPFRRQDSFAAMAANALTSMSRRMSNPPPPKTTQPSRQQRDSGNPSASSSDVDDQSGNVTDLAEFWREYKRSRKYEHPFGKKADLLGQILCGDREESSENQTDSAAKIIIWMVFFFFMVGVAGAIILGAETAIRSIPRNLTITTASPSS